MIPNRKCRHCKAWGVVGNPDLCPRCYNNRPVRLAYMARLRRKKKRLEKLEKRDTPGIKTGKKVLPTPTDALPGSEEKIRILQERYEAGFHLHHPKDRIESDEDNGFVKELLRKLSNE